MCEITDTIQVALISTAVASAVVVGGLCIVALVVQGARKLTGAAKKLTALSLVGAVLIIGAMVVVGTDDAGTKPGTNDVNQVEGGTNTVAQTEGNTDAYSCTTNLYLACPELGRGRGEASFRSDGGGIVSTLRTCRVIEPLRRLVTNETCPNSRQYVNPSCLVYSSLWSGWYSIPPFVS